MKLERLPEQFERLPEQFGFGWFPAPAGSDDWLILLRAAKQLGQSQKSYKNDST